MGSRAWVPSPKSVVRLRQLYWLSIGVVVFTSVQTLRDGYINDTLVLIASVAALFAVPILDARARHQEAGLILVTTLTVMIVLLSWQGGGSHDLALLALPSILTFAALLGIHRMFYALVGLMVANLALLGIAQQHGWAVFEVQSWGYSAAVYTCLILLVNGLVTWLMASDYRVALNQLSREVANVDASRREVEFLANHDHLTGLPNRLLARDRFEHAVSLLDGQPGHRLAVLFIDLDEFKHINDSLGHVAGDEFLVKVANRLRAAARPADTVCRIGGDEFLLLMEGVTDVRDVTLTAEALLERLAAPVQVQGYRVACTASIGIVVYPDDATDYDEAVKHADVAMYRTKEVGKNSYHFYDDSMNRAALERMELLNDLRCAMGTSQLYLEYQPIIDLARGCTVGAEALLRWRHPERGLLYPGFFIGLAEKAGLMNDIVTLTLSEACALAGKLNAAGLSDFYVAVNVSPVQLKRNGFADIVLHQIAAHGLAASTLALELTESEFVHDSDVFERAWRQLNNHGVKFSIDDFGTGYSNLGYLRRLSVHQLKIDKVFVVDIDSNPDNNAIVRAIHNVARDLDMVTVAEGVESHAQAQALRQIGIERAQGFLWSPSISGEALLARMQREVRAPAS